MGKKSTKAARNAPDLSLGKDGLYTRDDVDFMIRHAKTAKRAHWYGDFTAAVRALSESDQKIIMTLVNYREKRGTKRAIAQALGIREDAARMRVMRAKRRLLHALTRYPYFLRVVCSCLFP